MITRKDVQYMRQVIACAKIFSTCSRRQYYAIIVDSFGHVIGSGYNGAPRNMTHCVDGGCPRAQGMAVHGSVYNNCVAIHAEANAIIHSEYTARSNGCTLYVNGPPCWDCAKLIANSGLTRVVYIADDEYNDSERVLAFLLCAGIEIEEYRP